MPKTAAWKAAALATGLGVAMLAYPAHAVPASGGDTVQGLYDALLGTMKAAARSGKAGVSHVWNLLYVGPLTSRQWPAYRWVRPGLRCQRRSGNRLSTA